MCIISNRRHRNIQKVRDPFYNNFQSGSPLEWPQWNVTLFTSFGIRYRKLDKYIGTFVTFYAGSQHRGDKRVKCICVLMKNST